MTKEEYEQLLQLEKTFTEAEEALAAFKNAHDTEIRTLVDSITIVRWKKPLSQWSRTNLHDWSSKGFTYTEWCQGFRDEETDIEIPPEYFYQDINETERMEVERKIAEDSYKEFKKKQDQEAAEQKAQEDKRALYAKLKEEFESEAR